MRNTIVKSIMNIILASSIILVLSACGGSDDGSDESVTIKVSNTFGKDHPQNIAMSEKFKSIVEEKTNNAIQVEIYEDSKLGDEKEVYDGVRTGTIDMVIAGTIMSDDVPKMSIGDWPFLFKDLDHAKKVLNGPVGDEVKEELEEKADVKSLGWSANGFRMFSSNKSLENMEDLRGQKIRLPDIDNFTKMGKALELNVTNLPFEEVFTALEQKVVDGQDNPISTLKANGWYEVQKYVLESKHVFSLNNYLINKELFNSFSDEEQNIIEEAAKETADYEWELTAESYEKDKAFLQDKGVEFVTPDEGFTDEFKEKMEPFYKDVYEEYPWAEELVQKIRDSD